MDEKSLAISRLKEILQHAVERFLRLTGTSNEFIRQTLERLHSNRWPAVVFGGALRSLLMSVLRRCGEGRPRDLDIVVAGPKVENLRDTFANSLVRLTRFGGLQLRRADWQFDVWPLDRTWAFVQDQHAQVSFAQLPQTTFLNIEAAAIELWSQEGLEREAASTKHARKIYSGKEQFFHAILDRVVEINREDNPFPDLCVVRALVMAHELGFALGARLGAYITEHGVNLRDDQLLTIQEKHYGGLRVDTAILRGWIAATADAHRADPKSVIQLPFTHVEANLACTMESPSKSNPPWCSEEHLDACLLEYGEED
jgi:hypothetical protein